MGKDNVICTDDGYCGTDKPTYKKPAKSTQYSGSSGHDVCMDNGGHCFDHGQEFDWDAFLSGYYSGPTKDTLIQQNISEIADTGELLVSIVWEPADWSLTAYHCLNGDCSLWVLAGLIPLIPSGAGRYAGDFIEGGIRLVGQKHHVLSTKIIRTLAKHETLSGVFQRSELIVQAIDAAAHNGYEAWHRVYDDEVVEWLTTKGVKASPRKFLSYLISRYAAPEMQQKFPYAVQVLTNALEALP